MKSQPASFYFMICLICLIASGILFLTRFRAQVPVRIDFDKQFQEYRLSK
ncbi:hypothetical protein EDC14_102217 [Hydrogenispora ethanolica]|uniref:Uncharacterized protein n=1 Tax=Hydrogenispora ethanolica TaxID=1082276 RepID=A0A4R1RB10_HYDET|nr:hypothetical protein EDC14_102217 [Hydrogenispora ethanolica]